MKSKPTCTQWDFIRQMRGILEIKNTLTLAELKLLLTLFEVNNSQGRKEAFQIDNKGLAELAGMKTPNIINLRKTLQAKGLVSYEAGKKGRPTTYKLRILYDMGKGYADDTETNKKGYAETTLKNKKGYAKTTLNYAETTLKVPNPAPDKGCRTRKSIIKDNIKDTLTSEGELFEIFWKSYPRKKAKQTAERAFHKKVKPEQFQAIMKALEAQKRSADWQKDGGKYIPYPATWLNGERWEDELEEAPPPEAATFSLEEQAARQRAEDERQRLIMERIAKNGG